VCFRQTLSIAQELNDRLLEAQACYSLGNTYTLLKDYQKAIDYHLCHLQIAQELKDSIGEGRAYWSLGNALTSIGNHREALVYAQRHFDISCKIGDTFGQKSAAKSIADLKALLNLISSSSPCSQSTSSSSRKQPKEVVERQALIRKDVYCYADGVVKKKPNKRESMENMNLIKLSPAASSAEARDATETSNDNENNADTNNTNSNNTNEDDYFLDLLAKFQSKRLDDQRCSLDRMENKENHRPERFRSGRPRRGTASLYRSTTHPSNPDPAPNNSNSRRNSNPVQNDHSVHNSNHHNANGGNQHFEHYRDELFDLIEGMQSRRMEEQRATMPPLRRSYTDNGPESLPGLFACLFFENI